MDSGTVFAGCRIESEAGRGGMGVVYRAVQLALDRPVALKLLAPELASDAGFRARFQQESRLAASIDHPNVVDIYEAGEDDGRLFIEMRWVDGSDLRAEIDQRGPLEPRRAAAIVAQVAGALDAAHTLGLVHRDVKPANILLGQRLGAEHAYLTDFGLTKRVASAGGLTQTGQWVGTLDYVAPEQIKGGNVDARTDVYALGGVLMHALTGHVPFDRDSDVAKMWGHINDPPVAPSSVVAGLPPELDAVVLRAMAKEPDERYPSAGDLGRAALAAAEGREPEAPERMVAVGEAAPAGAEPEPTIPKAPTTAAAAEPPTVAPPPPPPPPPPPGATPPAAAPPPPPAAPQHREPMPPPPPGPPPPPPAARPPGRGGRIALLAVVAVVLLLGLAAGVLAATGAFSSSDKTETGASTADTGGGVGPPPDTVQTTSTSVTAAAVRGVLDRYAAAYSAHDLAGLTALFAPGFTRSNNDQPPRPVDAALAEYRKQFDQFPNSVYRLDVVSVKPGNGEASASANYTITNAGPGPSTGSIGFHMRVVKGELLIDAIAIRTS
jgi:outer membrane biosynthesis protein TonB